MPTVNATADDNLAPDNYGELNRAFYSARPSDYFNQRLENLMLVAGRHKDLLGKPIVVFRRAGVEPELDQKAFIAEVESLRASVRTGRSHSSCMPVAGVPSSVPACRWLGPT